jgi:hypothetical protein
LSIVHVPYLRYHARGSNGPDRRAEEGWDMGGRFCFLRGLTFLILFVYLAHAGCYPSTTEQTAELLIVNGNVYTLSWGEPDLDGIPSVDAPHSAAGWKADGEAVAVSGGKILFVGKVEEAEKYRGDTTRVIDVHGATVVPGLIQSHVHVAEFGQSLRRVDVRSLETVEEIVAKVEEATARVPAGQWIEGYGIYRNFDSGCPPPAPEFTSPTYVSAALRTETSISESRNKAG